MAVWNRVHARIRKDIEEAGSDRLYDGRVPDAEIFHTLVQLAEGVLVTGGPPLPFAGPVYEAPNQKRVEAGSVDELIEMYRETLDIAKRIDAKITRALGEAPDEAAD